MGRRDLHRRPQQRGITTWSIADPERPTEIGRYEIDQERLQARPYNYGLHSVDLYLHPTGEWACIVPTFDCFDLSDPTRPNPYRWDLDEWPCTWPYHTCSYESDVAFLDDRLAVVRDESEIWLLDLAQDSPSAWIRPESWTDRFEHIQAVTFADDVLLVLEADKTLTAWDLKDPAHPVEIASSTLDTDQTYVSGWKLRGHMFGAVAIGTGWWPREIVAIATTHLPYMPSADLTDELEWNVVEDLEIEGEIVERVRLRDSIAILLTKNGLATVDVSRPATPHLITHQDFDRICCQLELNGDTAVVGSWDYCKMSLIDISNPAHLIKRSDALFCDPNHWTWEIRTLNIIDDIAYVQRPMYLNLFDISDPRNPVLLMDYFDYYLDEIHATRDYLLATFDSEVRLCQITDDFDLVVGRVYDDLRADTLASPGVGLVAASTYSSRSLVDFSNLLEPKVYEVPLADGRLPVGAIADPVWLRPSRHELDLVSLECLPPEASFRWAGADFKIWFEDTTRYQVEERLWDFGDGAMSTERVPAHTYAEPGRYRVNLTVQNTIGSDTVTRTVHVLPAQRRDDSSPLSAVD